MKKIALISAIATTLFTLNTQAENYYVEASLGNSEIESESGSSFGILGGYKLYDQDQVKVSAELGYNKYLKIESDSIFGNVSQDISSIALGTKVSYSPMAKVGVFGRFAYEAMIADTEIFGESTTTTSDEFSYAVGAEYEVANNFSLGTQYKLTPLDGGANLTNVTVSANYHF